MIKRISLVVISAVVLLSCSKNIDFGKFNDITLSPNLKVPIVKATLKLEDLLVDDSTLTQNPDGSLKVLFREDSLFGFTAIDFVKIPPQTPTLIPLVYDTAGVPFNIDLNLGTLAGASLTEAVFDKGYLVYEISTANLINSDTEIRLKIKNATIGGNVFSNLLIMPPNQFSIKDSIDISGLTFDFSNGGTATNFLGFELSVERADSASQFQNYGLSINFSALEIANAEGFFGQKVINIPNGSFDFDISAFENFAQGVFLTNPTIRLLIDNSMGIGVGIEPDFLGVNSQGLITELGVQPIIVGAPAFPGNTVNSVIEINASNSQIVPFLASLPKLISYGGQGQLNPGGQTSNFINKNSRLDIGLEVEIPLELRADDVILEEIVEIGAIADTGETDLIETFTLFFRTTNRFPFDVEAEVTFLDSITNDSLAGVSLQLLSAAPVDANGRVTQAMVFDETVEFSKEQIDALLRSRKIKIRAKINTSNDGQTAVTLFTDYDLELRMAVQTNVNIPIIQ